jgi:hypothetical protein
MELPYKVIDRNNNKIKGYYNDEQDAKLVCDYYNKINYINNKRQKGLDRYIVINYLIGDNEVETLFYNLTHLIRSNPDAIIRNPTSIINYHYM